MGRTYKDVAQMTRTQLEREKQTNSTKQSAINDKLIALGYGSYRLSEIPYELPERQEYINLQSRHADISGELERIALGYRKATPER